MAGKLVVFEGIDGSGKSTQFQMLCGQFAAEGRTFRRLIFPQYAEPSSALLRMYLNGEFGTRPGDVNAYAASTFYAVDRYASFRKVWGEDYKNGGLILADRYTTSNAVHQGAKLPAGERRDFFRWLFDFEYRLLGLPAPDFVIYLDMPAELSMTMLRAREKSRGTKGDIHETDGDYLAACRESALQAAKEYGWHRIECAREGAVRPAEEIQTEIRALLLSGKGGL